VWLVDYRRSLLVDVFSLFARKVTNENGAGSVWFSTMPKRL
jgi:hypothetical protein